MSRSRRTRDDLAHQRSPKVIAAGVKEPGASVKSEFHPGRLDVGDQAVEGEARHRMDQHRFVPSGARATVSPEIDRRSHVHEGKGYELGESARAALNLADNLEVVGPRSWIVDVPEHQGGGCGQTKLMGGDHHFGPLRATNLVRAKVNANIIVEHFRRRSGETAQSGIP